MGFSPRRIGGSLVQACAPFWDCTLSGLAIAPTDAEICHLLFQIALQQSEYQQALKWGQRMIILAKDRASYYQQLAQLYHKLDNLSQAYELLEQAVNIALSSDQLQRAGELQLELAVLYLTCGAYTEAYKAIQ